MLTNGHLLHQETYFPCMTMEGINEWPQIRSLWLPPSPSGISEFWHPTNYDNIYYIQRVPPLSDKEKYS